MLHAISWMHFIECILFLVLLYYATVIGLFFRKEAIQFLKNRRKTLLIAVGLMGSSILRAQDGNQGINQANSLVRQYFDTGAQLLYAVGGVIALVGAIRVYRLWNEDDGHGQAYRAAAGWFGSCIFLVVVVSVIRSFYGL